MRSRPLLLALLLSLAAAPAAADGGPAWPVFRADPARTARVDGAGAIASPEVAWELSLGGSLSERELLLADLDGDARPEMLRIAAGRVVAAVPGAAPRWSSPQLGALAIFDATDLDGAGGPEVIALAGRPSAVVILAGDDGRLLWTLPVDSDVVDARAVRPTPGEAPVLVTNHRFQNVEAFGFAGGFVDPATNRLWQSAGPIRWSIGLAFGDTDGDGVLDLIKTYDRTVSVLDLRTGAVRASSAALMSEDVYFYSASVADVDGDGRAEILVADYSYFYSEGSGLAVLHESAGAVVPKWAPILFEDDVTSGPGNDVFRHQVVVHANSLADLDGALPLELVFSVWDEAADQWTTRVVNAATGMNVAAMTGEILEAVANLDEDAALEVVTRDVAGIDFAGRPTPFFSSLRAYDVSAGSATDRGFRRADARAALTGSRRRSAGTEADPVSTWRDVNGDGRPELYIYVNYADEFVNENRADAMEAMRGSDGTSAASYGFPPLAEGTLLDSAPNVLAAGSFDALVFTTDGMLRAIDLAFRDRDAQRTGNHARRPLVAVLEGLARILAVDSARTLRVIDGRTLAPDAPALAWQTRNIEQTSARGYVETPGVPVGSALLLRGRAAEDFQRPALVRFSASGEEAFRVALPERVGWSGYGDWQVHDWSGDGVPDVFLTLTQPDGSAAPERALERGRRGGARRHAHRRGDRRRPLPGGVPADVNGDGAPEDRRQRAPAVRRRARPRDHGDVGVDRRAGRRRSRGERAAHGRPIRRRRGPRPRPRERAERARAGPAHGPRGRHRRALRHRHRRRGEPRRQQPGGRAPRRRDRSPRRGARGHGGRPRRPRRPPRGRHAGAALDHLPRRRHGERRHARGRLAALRSGRRRRRRGQRRRRGGRRLRRLALRPRHGGRIAALVDRARRARGARHPRGRRSRRRPRDPRQQPRRDAARPRRRGELRGRGRHPGARRRPRGSRRRRARRRLVARRRGLARRGRRAAAARRLRLPGRRAPRRGGPAPHRARLPRRASPPPAQRSSLRGLRKRTSATTGDQRREHDRADERDDDQLARADVQHGRSVARGARPRRPRVPPPVERAGGERRSLSTVPRRVGDRDPPGAW
ncbi:MAG: VCBS repeat-containing protein [Sandaracinaceae bacterium]|nr:VCBS repeat-containing protein [Sandaracinaceae bacterium]